MAIPKCCHGCHVCGVQFLAEVSRPDQEPPFYCAAHITQAYWYQPLLHGPVAQERLQVMNGGSYAVL